MQQEQREMAMKVLRIVSERSIENPITGGAIAGMLGIQWRAVADCIEALRFSGFKIGSSKKEPMGYFLAKYPEEMIGTICRMRETCKVQLAMLKKMATWDNIQPTLYEGYELDQIDKALQEYHSATGEVIV